MKARRTWVIAGSVGLGLLAILLVSRVARPESRSGVTSAADSSIGTNVGQKAPAFTVTTTDGTTLRSEDLRGQVLVLTSSAAWCQTCAIEAQQLSAVYELEKERPVTFLTVDIDPRDTPEVINAFRTRMQTPWVYAPANGAEQLIRDFGLTRFEITYVIDAQGIVRYRDASITNAADLENTLWPLL